MKSLLLTGIFAIGWALNAHASLTPPDSSIDIQTILAVRDVSVVDLMGPSSFETGLGSSVQEPLLLAFSNNGHPLEGISRFNACSPGTVYTALVPVPEPSTWLAGAILMAVFLAQGIRSLRCRIRQKAS